MKGTAGEAECKRDLLPDPERPFATLLLTPFPGPPCI